jgi:hypothetical protein
LRHQLDLAIEQQKHGRAVSKGTSRAITRRVGTTQGHQWSHTAFCCKFMRTLEIRPRLGHVTFYQRNIAQKLQRIGLLRRLSTLFG